MILNNQAKGFYMILAAVFIFFISFYQQAQITKGYLKSDTVKNIKGDVIITPVSHASFIINADSKTIYVDPVGEVSQFSSFSKPDIILITDMHGDHFNVKLIHKLKTGDTVILGPSVVTKQVTGSITLNNGDTRIASGFKIIAMPAYNMTKEQSKFHQKGRGNGYILELSNKRIYISGDTEDIPEMRALENIDIAFLCMNLPYTMTEEQAASAVLAFKPKIVYPYHFRGKKDGKPYYSDVENFKKVVAKDPNIDVRILKWY